MELHNIVEDTVLARVDEIFGEIKKEGNPDNLCICEQCRMDTICYTLNRMPPHYILSNRGAAWAHKETMERQQQIVDVSVLIYEGLKKINHNQRPNFSHTTEDNKQADPDSGLPIFNIPTIVGRLLNGDNFAPLSNGKVELLFNGELVQMMDKNWQNPCHIIPNTEGAFSFWPVPAAARNNNEHTIFQYTLRVTVPEFEDLIHFFKIPVASEINKASSFTLERTHKLHDLYMFPPGEAEQNG